MTDASEVRTTRLVLVDPDGNERGAMGVEPDGTARMTLKGPGSSTMELEAGTDTRVRIKDRDGKVRLSMGLGADGAPSVSLLTGKEETAVGIVAGSDGSAIAIHDVAGREALVLHSIGAATAVVGLEEGVPRFSIGSVEGGPIGVMSLADRDGKPMMVIGSDAEGRPSVTMAQAGLMRLFCGVGTNGEPWLQLHDTAGKIRAALSLVAGEPTLQFFDAAGAKTNSVNSKPWYG